MDRPRHPGSILIVRPSALGDVCRTVPVLASLRKAFPDARIDWVVRNTFVEAIAAHPALNEPVPFPRSRFARWWRNPAAAGEMIRWFSDLRRRRYDLVIDCQGLGRSGLITLATGAPKRVGFRHAREFAWLGYNVRYRPPQPLHTVDEMLSLLHAIDVEPVTDMRLYLAEADEAWWEQRRAELGLDGGRYAVLAPTARWASKRWPIERWRELVRPLLDRAFQRLIIIGAPGETDQVRDLYSDREPPETTLIDLVGQTSVGQTMAIIAGSDLVIANDSAPLHVAVGFDRPCVALFGPTDPNLAGPYRRPDSIVRRCRPNAGQTINYRDPKLGDGLMRLISVQDVIDGVDGVLASGSVERVPGTQP